MLTKVIILLFFKVINSHKNCKRNEKTYGRIPCVKLQNQNDRIQAEK